MREKLNGLWIGLRWSNENQSFIQIDLKIVKQTIFDQICAKYERYAVIH